MPPGALGVNTAPQRTIEGWVLRRRADSPSAAAARAALGAPDEGSEALSPQATAELQVHAASSDTTIDEGQPRS